MNVAFIDTSCLLAIAFGERGSTALVTRLGRFTRWHASPLLEAELRCAFAREGTEFDSEFLSALEWINVDRPLSDEISRVLAAGYARGADCWHLATALYVAPVPDELTFLTLNAGRRKVAARLGFQT